MNSINSVMKWLEGLDPNETVQWGTHGQNADHSFGSYREVKAGDLLAGLSPIEPAPSKEVEQ